MSLELYKVVQLTEGQIEILKRLMDDDASRQCGYIQGISLKQVKVNGRLQLQLEFTDSAQLCLEDPMSRDKDSATKSRILPQAVKQEMLSVNFLQFFNKLANNVSIRTESVTNKIWKSVEE